MNSKKVNPANFQLPDDVQSVLKKAPNVTWASTTQELMDAACGPAGNDFFEVLYALPSSGRSVMEATVARVRNGIVANYPESYMRRRERDCLFIADELPSDKPRFAERFGYPFSKLREETFAWLEKQDLTAFAFDSGQGIVSIPSLAIVPTNAAFFALGLALLQGITPISDLPLDYKPQAILIVAPPFRHTHFNGKQVVVHDRHEDGLHEMFAYNLYPGPSAKKGVYGVLIHHAEREEWVVPHCSTVQVITPYDNVITLMHEGASGGGKSEMLEQLQREPDGRILLGKNIVTGERRYLEIPRACELRPVTDDIALCPPQIQENDGLIHVMDAETSWFVRVDHISDYGTDPHLEKLTAQPSEPLMFLNIDAAPRGRALLWEHIEDAPGKPCPNPRVILPRPMMPDVVNEPVAVDIRSFGVRTPPCTKDDPTYGIIGLFHLLPPALAWLWRLVAPSGHANPSIVHTEGMHSEGIGSYWPFATGRRVPQANLLLKQIISSPKVHYVLVPNQYIGAWKTGFMAQWIAREYLARRGYAKFKEEQISPSRCPLLGYALNHLLVEGRHLPHGFLKVESQPEVGEAAYDAGAEILYDFFRKNLALYLEEDLDPLGRQIIDCCLANGTPSDYAKLIKSAGM
ncbi:TPA: DUF4914 domain-containing protein [Candidatus Sumerlaeota bacterium]|jgi:hypothetical protein|nr:DUF4914 domain-containing protein [Candidatus Sumerlaeota bacterium]